MSMTPCCEDLHFVGGRGQKEKNVAIGNVAWQDLMRSLKLFFFRPSLSPFLWWDLLACNQYHLHSRKLNFHKVLRGPPGGDPFFMTFWISGISIFYVPAFFCMSYDFWCIVRLYCFFFVFSCEMFCIICVIRFFRCCFVLLIRVCISWWPYHIQWMDQWRVIHPESKLRCWSVWEFRFRSQRPALNTET